MAVGTQREGIYGYIEPIHFVLQQKITHHCEAIILQLKKKKDCCSGLSAACFLVSRHLEASGLGGRLWCSNKVRDGQETCWGRSTSPLSMEEPRRDLFLSKVHSFDKHTPSTYHVQGIIKLQK